LKNVNNKTKSGPIPTSLQPPKACVWRETGRTTHGRSTNGWDQKTFHI